MAPTIRNQRSNYVFEAAAIDCGSSFRPLKQIPSQHKNSTDRVSRKPSLGKAMVQTPLTSSAFNMAFFSGLSQTALQDNDTLRAWVRDSSFYTYQAISGTKKARQTLSIRDRKHFFIHSPTEKMRQIMQKHVSENNEAFGGNLPANECWLHPWPPECRMQPTGSMKRDFYWSDSTGSHKLVVNYGVVALMVENGLSETQKDGYINKSWQLSHLCGNWICCNPKHFTMESGRSNITRKKCFRSQNDCHHTPQCKKHLKRKQLMTQNIRRKIYNAIDGIEYTYDLTEEKSKLVHKVKEYSSSATYCGLCKRPHILAFSAYCSAPPPIAEL